MDLWPSSGRFESRKLPRFHRCLKERRQLTPARTRRAVPARVWEGVATQLALLNHPHMAVHPHLAGDLRAGVRASGIEKDLFSPIAPLLPCWSIVIAASESGVSTKTGVFDGSVLMDQRLLQWVSKLLLLLKCGTIVEIIWNFDCTAAEKNVQNGNRHFGTQWYDYVPNASQFGQHRSGARCQNSARSAKTRSVEGVQQCHKIRQMQSSGGRLPLPPAPASRQAGNTRAACRGVVDRATADPVYHQRMTRKYMLDMFGGSGFLTKATNLVGLCG